MQIDRRRALPGILLWWMSLPWWLLRGSPNELGTPASKGQRRRRNGYAIPPSWPGGRWRSGS